MKALRIYIAGPISKGDLLHNVKQSDAAFERLAKAGLAPFNPMWSVYAGGAVAHRFPGDLAEINAVGTRMSRLAFTHAEWLRVDLPWVEASHAVLRLPGESTGADRETTHARQHGIPVFEDIAELEAWAVTRSIFDAQMERDFTEGFYRNLATGGK